MKKKHKGKQTINGVLWSFKIVSELGLSVTVPLVGGAFLGSYLDRNLNTSPKLTLSFILIGLFLGLYSMYKIVKDSI